MMFQVPSSKFQVLLSQLGTWNLELGTWVYHPHLTMPAALVNPAPPAGSLMRSAPTPCEPSTNDRRPLGLSEGCNTTAPAPSPKSTQVARSCQSMKRESASAATTSTVL